jgi:predicted nucleotidyltransferase
MNPAFKPRAIVVILMPGIIQPGLLEQAVERLKSEFQPEQIWLFGSHAWGTPTEDSDVDLMVIVPTSDERPIRRMQRAQRCLRGIGFAKDVPGQHTV